jgi:hypothetical protein
MSDARMGRRPKWRNVWKRRSLHIVPIADLHRHQLARSCWCEPFRQRGNGTTPIVIHNSADGRELIERHGLQ